MTSHGLAFAFHASINVANRIWFKKHNQRSSTFGSRHKNGQFPFEWKRFFHIFFSLFFKLPVEYIYTYLRLAAINYNLIRLQSMVSVSRLKFHRMASDLSIDEHDQRQQSALPGPLNWSLSVIKLSRLQIPYRRDMRLFFHIFFFITSVPEFMNWTKRFMSTSQVNNAVVCVEFFKISFFDETFQWEKRKN